jgi:hypothetical protein
MTTARGGPQARAGVLATLVAAMAGLVAVLCGLTFGGPAAAGGADWITPARDRYEPGQTVVMIGYGDPGAGWREKGPFHAYLRVDPIPPGTASSGPLVKPTDRWVATVVVEAVEPSSVASWWTHRASITFDLPPDLLPASYEVLICDDPCTDAALGTFWPSAVYVGIDPATPIVRRWPLTEPGIRWLEDDALIAVDGWHLAAPAADVRAGRIPPPPLPVPAEPDPALVEPAAPGAVASPVTTETSDRTVTAATTATSDDAVDAGKADDRTWAWWIAGEIAVLVGGCTAARWWIGRRRGRRGNGDGDGGSPAPSPRPPSSVPRLVYEPDPEDASPDGPLRQPVRIRL